MLNLDITEQDLIDLKEGTVDMYTFSYYMSSLITTHEIAGCSRWKLYNRSTK